MKTSIAAEFFLETRTSRETVQCAWFISINRGYEYSCHPKESYFTPYAAMVYASGVLQGNLGIQYVVRILLERPLIEGGYYFHGLPLQV